MSKLQNLFLDWQDRSSFVGVGKVLRMLDFKPVVFYEDKYYQPRRCLIEIVNSDKYKPGFKKHFIIPFSIPKVKAEKLLKKETKIEKSIPYNMIEEILDRGNPIIDTKEEIELRDMVLTVQRLYTFRGLSVPTDIMDEILDKKNKNDNLRYDLLD